MPCNSPPASTKLYISLDAARDRKEVYTATLHKELQPFLNSLSDEVLRTYINFWYKNEKKKEMCLDPTHVSTSVIKDVDLTLQALEEVNKSGGMWASMYQDDAIMLGLNGGIRPGAMPLTVEDGSLELQDRFFTPLFPHPSCE